jgi:hypothetical protein
VECATETCNCSKNYIKIQIKTQLYFLQINAGMKNKKLLFSLLTAFIGIAIFSLNATGTFNNFSASPNANENDAFEASMEYLASLRNNQVTGTIDPADVMQASEMSMKNSALGLGINWISGGPDNFSGRTRALLYDLQDPDYKTIYAASTSGGLWKSTTGGILWDPIPGTEHIMNVTCMVQDSTGRIYVGTGETFNVFRFAAYPGFIGNGIHISDNGSDFTALTATVPTLNDDNDVWAYVNRISINPGNEQMLFAATNEGLKYSSDRGGSWQYAKSIDGEDLSGPSLDVKTGSDGVTVATVNSLVYISEFGEYDQFVNVSTGADTTLPFASISRSELAVSPTNPNIVYAVLVSGIPSVGQLQNVYLSVDKGFTWRVVGPGGSTFFNPFGSDNVGDYANVAVVHPGNSDVLYLGGKNLWKGTKIQDEGFYEWKQMLGTGEASWFINSNHHTYAFKPNDPNTLLIGTDRGIFMSDNNLGSYTNMNKNYSTAQSYSVAFNSGKRILTGTQSNGVLFISETGNTDRQAHRIDENFTLNGANVAMSVINQKALIWSTAVPSVSVAAPVTIYRSDDLGETVALSDFQPASTTQRNFLPPMLYWENLNYTQSRDSISYIAPEDISAGEVIWLRSANSKYPFKYTVQNDLQQGDSIRVKDIIATRLFYGLQQSSSAYDVHMTKGAVQFTISPEWYRILSPQGYPQSFAFSKDGNYFWVGTKNGLLYRLGNMHQAYDSVTANVGSANYAIEVQLLEDFSGRIITSVAVDPQNNDHVLVTLGNYGNDHYVYRSTNATASDPVFESVQANLPKMPVYSSLIEMNDPNIVILGTDMGIWSTANIQNPDWASESGEMGEVAVFQIKQQLMNTPALTVPVDTLFETFPGVDNYGKIYLATFGRGIYKTTRFVGIGESPVSPGKISQNRLHIYPNPAAKTLYVDYNAESSAMAELKIVDLSGRIVKEYNFGILGAGKQTLQLDISALTKGVYIVQLGNGEKYLSNKLIVR